MAGYGGIQGIWRDIGGYSCDMTYVRRTWSAGRQDQTRKKVRSQAGIATGIRWQWLRRRGHEAHNGIFKFPGSLISKGCDETLEKGPQEKLWSPARGSTIVQGRHRGESRAPLPRGRRMPARVGSPMKEERAREQIFDLIEQAARIRPDPCYIAHVNPNHFDDRYREKVVKYINEVRSPRLRAMRTHLSPTCGPAHIA